MVLASVKEVAIFDPTPVEAADLGANFLLRESHIGRESRAEASQPGLQGLSPFVEVHVLPEREITQAVVERFSLLIVSEPLIPISQLLALNEATRLNRGDQRGVGLIVAFAFGLAGSIFVDFGDKHVIYDKTGSPTKSAYVFHVTEASEGVVTVDPETVFG